MSKLPCTSSISASSEFHPLEVTNLAQMTSFSVNYEKWQLLLPDVEQNQLLLVDLRTRNVTVTHDNYQGREQTKAFNTIKHLFSLPNQNKDNNKDDILYWTSDKGLDIETHESDGYYQATYGQQDLTLEHPAVFHSSQQPIPVPLNAPKGLQCVAFGPDRAEVQWIPVGNTGSECNAFQGWNYRVKLSNGIGSVTEEVNATAMSKTLVNLVPDTVYKVTVQGYTHSGPGPWSTGVTVKSLPENGKPLVIWAARNYLHESDLHFTDVNSVSASGKVVVISANEEETVAYTNGSAIFVKHQGERKYRTLVTGMSGIGSLVLEPFGQMAYFSIPGQQNILRMSYTGKASSPEILPVTAICQDLTIDSLGSQMCWVSLRNKVQCARLNGTGLATVYKVSQWSDSFITGLALDTVTTGRMYIMKKDYLTVTILSKTIGDLADIVGSTWREEVHFDSVKYSGPLGISFGKLTWLRQDNQLVIYDLEGKSVASKKLTEPGEDQIRAYAISQNPSQKFPDSVTSLNVIPEPVNPDSIQFSQGRVTWDPVTNINYGKVSYDVLVSGGNTEDKPLFHNTGTNSFHLADYMTSPFGPNSEFSVKIVSKTDWASSAGHPTVSKTFLTPQMPPAKPGNLRAYHENNNDNNNKYLSLTLRWDKPQGASGPISTYRITLDSDGQEKNYETPELEKRIHLDQNKLGQTWGISVRAENGAGQGNPARLEYFVDPSKSRPIPQFVIVQGDSLKLIDGDRAAVLTELRSKKGTKINSVDILAAGEDAIYLTEDGTLFSHNFGTNVIRELFQFRGSESVGNSAEKIRGLSVDWIGRYVYFSRGLAGDRTQISRIALDEPRPVSYPVLNVTGEVFCLAIEPFSSTLYYSQLTEDLKKYRIRARVLDLTGLPSRRHQDSYLCQPCLEDLKVPEFQISYTKGSVPEVFFVPSC